MASKAAYLKKYLRGTRKAQPPSTAAQGGLRLGQDEELDLQPRRGRGGPAGGPGARGKKTLFTVLRRAEDGARYLFKDENAEEIDDEELLDSDNEEVRVVGDDGQLLELSEADRAKVNELIAKEDEDDYDMPAAHLRGLRGSLRSRGSSKGASKRASEDPPEDPSPHNSSSSSSNNSWKEAFALEGPVCVGKPAPLPAASPYEQRGRRQQLEQQRDGDEDLSPPRRQGDKQQQELAATQQDRDLSPPRRKRDGDRDLSPPRRRPEGDRDLSPPRRRPEGDRDLSPPRRRPEGGRDLSPPRRRPEGGRDLSPPRRRPDGGRDLSPPRRRPEADRDLSPPRRRPEADRDISPPRRHRGPPEPTQRAGGPHGSETMSSPSMKGTRERELEETASAADRDLSPKRRDRRQESQEDDGPPSSRIVFRDREGRIISEEEWLTLEGEKGRKRHRERGPAPVLEWGAGLKQKEDKKARQREEEKIAKQPFARYDIDEEADAELRARERWDDPLNRAPSFKKSLQEQQNGKAEGANKIERPTCPHDAPPNRFGIKPGYRWDGVVRGNGFEEERLKAINRRKWEAEQAHMNNTADM
ncbi:GJ23850, related [Eimeria praecox]|uniref:GJ23850, related n=1 Tax=Eimeria praecox TaxID=51316 RepID=U6G5N1_9EIME|nr:GJ23850, related [Eimeria praecox]